ncbi:hypothetical protein BaRGS_00028188 [Batillaria attramentaria]|uniref:Uncharacterized protein n=1 Tax=Batillaria attramentaria TaxID=370345 RepID=A0ABD0K0L7_9CAEN
MCLQEPVPELEPSLPSTWQSTKRNWFSFARSADKLKTVQAACEQAGSGKGNVATVVADVGKQEDLERIIKEAVAAFGVLDVLVNNAAALVINDVEHTSPESFDRTIAVNLRAPFFLSQAAMPHLKKTGG